MATTYTTQHIVLQPRSAYGALIERLEALLGRLKPEIIAKLNEDPKYVEEKIISDMEGFETLILFQTFDHGTLLKMAGQTRRAMQYLIGNPRIASLMSRHDIRAALYAPLRVLIFEKEDKTVQIEYDLPSSLFGQFGNEEVTSVALSLDRKLEALIRKADEINERIKSSLQYQNGNFGVTGNGI